MIQWKKIILSTIAAIGIACFAGGTADAASVKIDEKTFPNACVRTFANKQDTNHDGELSDAEIKAVTKLDWNGQNLYTYGVTSGMEIDFTGMEIFTNLKQVTILEVRSVHVVNSALKAGVHYREILIRESYVHDKLRLVLIDKRGYLLRLRRVDLCGGYYRLRCRSELFREGFAVLPVAARDADLGKDLRNGTALVNRDARYRAAAYYKNS